MAAGTGAVVAVGAAVVGSLVMAEACVAVGCASGFVAANGLAGSAGIAGGEAGDATVAAMPCLTDADDASDVVAVAVEAGELGVSEAEVDAAGAALLLVSAGAVPKAIGVARVMDAWSAGSVAGSLAAGAGGVVASGSAVVWAMTSDAEAAHDGSVGDSASAGMKVLMSITVSLSSVWSAGSATGAAVASADVAISNASGVSASGASAAGAGAASAAGSSSGWGARVVNMPAACALPAAISAAASPRGATVVPASAAHCAVLASIERSVSCRLGEGSTGCTGLSVQA
ncbi:hypothetical protein KTE93_28980 [Burkholderia gladioli]|nr:hypothetical protein [Burkholderia gladioli]